MLQSSCPQLRMLYPQGEIIPHPITLEDPQEGIEIDVEGKEKEQFTQIQR